MVGALTMTTLIIVHGAFGGGWEWTPVARILQRQGHKVLTPTLTGLGDRSSLAGPDVGLTTHIEDLVKVLKDNGPGDAVLCAASYGGMPATGAADRLPQRIAGIVYVDALVPRDGESALDLLPPSFGTEVRNRLSRSGNGFNVPVPSAVLPPKTLISERTWSDYVSRLCPQPAATFAEPIRLTRAIDKIPRGFIRCTRSVLPSDPIEPVARRARDAHWTYRELELPHDPHLFDPDATARAIADVARHIVAPAARRRDSNPR